MTVDTGLVVMFSFLDLRIPRNGPYARSYASGEQMSPPSLVCKQNSLHLHSFCVCPRVSWETIWMQNFATFPHFTIRFPEIGNSRAQPQQQITDHECQNKSFAFSHNRAFAASYSRGTKALCWGVGDGRSGTRQTNSSLHLSYNFLCLSSPSPCLGVFAIFVDKPFGSRFG